VLVAALLEPDVVVGAHAGEHRHFFAAQAGHPAAGRARGQTDLFGPGQLPARPEELTQSVVRHATTVKGAVRRKVAV
jgi:hypothetical protein